MQNPLKTIMPYIDSFGLIAQGDLDGGDSAQREGMLLTAAAALYYMKQLPLDDLIEIRWRFLGTVQWKLIRDDGRLRRHSDITKWYSQWDRGSRDQYHIIIGMGLVGIKEVLWLMFKDHCTRLLLWTTNTKGNSYFAKSKLPDFTGPGFLAMWVRAFNQKHPAQLTVRLALCVLDISMVIQSLIWRFYHLKFNKEHTDILNHVQVMIQSKISLDTPVAKLARWILKDAPIQSMFENYFDASTNGVTSFITIYKPIIRWLQET